MAAGEGTRMRSATPKVLHPLCGRPMLLHVIDALEQLPLQKIVVVVGHAAEHVEPRLRPLRERIEDALGRDAIMAGSGPTYVVLADGPVGLPDRAQELSAAIGVPVVAAATVSKAVRLEL